MNVSEPAFTPQMGVVVGCGCKVCCVLPGLALRLLKKIILLFIYIIVNLSMKVLSEVIVNVGAVL